MVIDRFSLRSVPILPRHVSFINLPMALLDLAVIGDWLWRGEPFNSEAGNLKKEVA